MRSYRSVDELPFRRFVDIVCDEDYSALLKTEKTESTKKKELPFAQELFTEIYSEYADRLLGSEKGVYEDMKRYAIAISRAQILDACILVIANETVDADIERVLKRCGVRLCGDLEKDIETVTTARDVALRKAKEAKEKMEMQKTEEVNRSREHYLSLIASMSSHFKYGIPYTQITVGEFCALYNQMKTEIKEIKKMRKHGRHN